MLAEIKGEIRLLALQIKTDAETHAKTAEVEWSQQLAMVERSVSEDQQRRLAGAVPSFGDGILVCPTSAGAVVAVDLTTRSLLWGYRYPRGADVSGHMHIDATRIGNDSHDRQHWHDASVTIADDRVLITPVEVTGSALNIELHCLSLLDGKLLWKQPRSDGLYVACVHDDSALVISNDHLCNYAMADGEIEWETPLPEGSIPSGRGFFNGDQYFLPLSSAEVVAVNVHDGSIVSRAKSRAGTVPGNLICHDGAVISQSGAWLESFYQLDELQSYVKRTLDEKPDDANALALKAELALDKSEIDEALDLLRKSYSKSPDPRTRQLLVETLLEGLRSDFAKYRGTAPNSKS